MTSTAIEPVVIEDQLVDHLAIPESAMLLYRERITPDLLPEQDSGPRLALSFVMDYIDEYHEAPPAGIISAKIGYDEFLEPKVTVEYVIKELRERYQRKQMKAINKKIARLSGDPAEALEYAYQETTRLKAVTMGRGKTFDSTELHLVKEWAEARKARGDSPFGFGFAEVDDALGGGMQPSSINYVMARPKRTKSWQLVKAAVEGLRADKSSVLQTLEMPPEEMQKRITAMIAGVCWSRMAPDPPILNPKEWEMIEQANEWTRMQAEDVGAVIYVTQPPFGERTVPMLAQNVRDFGDNISAVMIDQFSYVEHMQPNAREYLMFADTCRRLKEMANEWPIYIACQLNRESEKIQEMMDLGGNAALTDAITQTADLMLGIRQSKEMFDNKVIEFGVIGSRSFRPINFHLKNNLDFGSDLAFLNRL